MTGLSWRSSFRLILYWCLASICAFFITNTLGKYLGDPVTYRMPAWATLLGGVIFALPWTFRPLMEPQSGTWPGVRDGRNWLKGIGLGAIWYFTPRVYHWGFYHLTWLLYDARIRGWPNWVDYLYQSPLHWWWLAGAVYMGLLHRRLLPALTAAVCLAFYMWAGPMLHMPSEGTLQIILFNITYGGLSGAAIAITDILFIRSVRQPNSSNEVSVR